MSTPASPTSPPGAPPERTARRDQIALLLTKLSVILILLGFVVVKRRPDAWPIAPWTMYSRHTNQIPPPITSEVELRLIDASGQSHRLLPTDLIPAGRRTVITRVMREAFDPDLAQPQRDAQRQYLAGIVTRRLPDQTRIVVEGWRTEWAVDPFALPPLDMSNPARTVLLGRFEVTISDDRVRVEP